MTRVQAADQHTHHNSTHIPVSAQTEVLLFQLFVFWLWIRVSVILCLCFCVVALVRLCGFAVAFPCLCLAVWLLPDRLQTLETNGRCGCSWQRVQASGCRVSTSFSLLVFD